MNLVFLDIDGVLNSVRNTVANPRGMDNLPARRYEELALDPVAVGLVKSLCEKTGAKIVISSSWRIGRTNADFVNIFNHYGWEDFPIIGYTLIMPTIRGVQIAAWMDAYSQIDSNEKIEQYVILDDSNDMLPEQMGNIVRTSLSEGLLLADYVAALRILDPNHPDLHPMMLGGY